MAVTYFPANRTDQSTRVLIPKLTHVVNVSAFGKLDIGARACGVHLQVMGELMKRVVVITGAAI